MYKKQLNEEYVRELMSKFENILLANSKRTYYPPTGRQEFCYKLLEIDYTRYDKNFELSFLETRSIFREILKSNKNNLETRDSFILYMKWKDCLETIVDSNNYLECLDKLRNNAETFWSLNELRRFCTKEVFLNFLYIEAIIDIKQIKYETQYIDIEELNNFRNIDNYWFHNQHEDAYTSCRALFLSVVVKRLNKEIIDPKNDVPEYIRKITEKYKIDGLTENLLSALQAITNIRHRFGKKEPPRSKEDVVFLKNLENAQQIDKKVCTRLEIDLLKALHNLTMVLETEKNILGK
ncbi:10265_t:CDS:1 [Paraglomus occultum]|uniref:10265_t:CDS:1 n=1 Tax=Paraglomus occultum TaxID=144539 RepID=A0A9N9BY79_9GLOM|nr:10265_t:CDS:1 [Paraglomus occultum]